MKFKNFFLEKYENYIMEESLKKKLLEPENNPLKKKEKDNSQNNKKDEELDRIMLLSGIKGNFKKMEETRGNEQKYDYRQKKIKKKDEIIDSFYFRGGLSSDIRRAGSGDNPLYNNLNDKFKNKK